MRICIQRPRIRQMMITVHFSLQPVVVLFIHTVPECAGFIQWAAITQMEDSGIYYRRTSVQAEKKTPVLLRDWLGYKDLPRYEAYIQNWHDFKIQVENSLDRLTDKSRDSVTRYILQIFFVHPYLTDQDFYPQYDVRMEVCRQALTQILIAVD